MSAGAIGGGGGNGGGRDKPATLQKHRRFTEAYEDGGAAASAGHSGSSGPAKRVMDFFRKRGKARGGE
jgi:protein-serine/threonine kinase